MIDLDRLSEYLRKSSANTIVLSFSDIERIIESELPVEAKQTAKWWWNIKDSKKAKSWLDCGYSTFDQKSIPERGSVCFKRTERKSELQKGFSRLLYFLTDRDAELHQKVMAVLEIFVTPILTLLALYVAVFPIKTQHQVRIDFANLVSEGDYAVENRNFLEAATYYHKASLTSYDVYSAAYSLHQEGACYMLYGLVENDEDYLNRALMIFENIANTPEYENTEKYQEAVIDLCYLYKPLGYDWQDEKWCSIVKKLEAMFNFNDLENISEEKIPVFISAAVNLGYYYKTALFSDPQMMWNEYYQQKAIYYSKAVTQLEIKYDEYLGVKIYDQAYLISIYELTSYMITNAFTNPKGNILDIFENARVLCQDAILTIDLKAQNILQMNVYIELKRNIGKTYIFSSYASASSDRDDYMQKAYQELISLFFWDEYELSENIMDVSNYLLVTGQCTENDIQLILNRFSSYLQIAQEKKDIPAQINIELKMLMACDLILLWYDYENINLTAQEVGLQLWTNLNNVLFDFLSSSQKALLSQYSEKFET